MKYIEPSVFSKAFTCPHCGVLSKQDWRFDNWYFTGNTSQGEADLRSGMCHHCNNHTLWVKDKMYYPDNGNVPFPNPEMPDKVKRLYLESASILTKSPRAAAALLRLSIQVLCKELGEKGENINNDIKELVKAGLPVIVQQSLDIVRVTGNDAVHPGQIDTDDAQTVTKLFELVNIIVDYMISLPNKVNGLYNSLPEDKINGIKKRDQ
ncbi:hypothetical protein AAE02nite_21510 [Adhaeribacter aerolatus]|uniref:DUF4145 domain-containing protein n=1 Tax=Adhaeribacter aerolatus TaxID=670289 RepID=A0A512AY92_9BACT|nr:DUF4145 domain-containing protein [Adhaeribacter aerolatus]GEO04487.1 hypothetical protein AAE02nite_21510 [Adhaeribacter aerolatus]